MREPGRFPQRYAGRSTTATAAAASRAVGSASDKAITFATGRRAVPPRCRISLCSVAGTTGLDRQPDGELRFRRPDGRVLPEVPPPHEVPDDPVKSIRARHEAQGLSIDARTSTPGWLGEPLDVGWAIDVLHPLAGSTYAELADALDPTSERW